MKPSSNKHLALRWIAWWKKAERESRCRITVLIGDSKVSKRRNLWRIGSLLKYSLVMMEDQAMPTHILKSQASISYSMWKIAPSRKMRWIQISSTQNHSFTSITGKPAPRPLRKGMTSLQTITWSWIQAPRSNYWKKPCTIIIWPGKQMYSVRSVSQQRCTLGAPCKEQMIKLQSSISQREA